MRARVASSFRAARRCASSAVRRFHSCLVGAPCPARKSAGESSNELMIQDTRQQGFDLRFQLLQIQFTLIPPDDTAIRIDEVTQRQSENTAETLTELRIPHRDGVIQVILLVRSLDRR